MNFSWFSVSKSSIRNMTRAARILYHSLSPSALRDEAGEGEKARVALSFSFSLLGMIESDWKEIRIHSTFPFGLHWTGIDHEVSPHFSFIPFAKRDNNLWSILVAERCCSSCTLTHLGSSFELECFSRWMAVASSFAAWIILLGTNFVPLTLTALLRIFAFSRRRRLAILLRAGLETRRFVPLCKRRNAFQDHPYMTSAHRGGGKCLPRWRCSKRSCVDLVWTRRGEESKTPKTLMDIIYGWSLMAFMTAPKCDPKTFPAKCILGRRKEAWSVLWTTSC